MSLLSQFNEEQIGDVEDETKSEIQAAMDELKQQSQIKAFGVLAVAFGSFVYLKLQYDVDPSSFVGSH